MPRTASVAVLSVGQNGQITIPAEFRRDHALSKGGKVIAVRMADALVMVPHDGVLESICLRLEEAMKGSGRRVDEVKTQALVERSHVVRERYGSGSSSRRGKRGR